MKADGIIDWSDIRRGCLRIFLMCVAGVVVVVILRLLFG